MFGFRYKQYAEWQSNAKLINSKEHIEKYIEEILKKGKLVFIKNTIKPKIIIETMLNIEKIINNEK